METGVNVTTPLLGLIYPLWRDFGGCRMPYLACRMYTTLLACIREGMNGEDRPRSKTILGIQARRTNSFRSQPSTLLSLICRYTNHQHTQNVTRSRSRTFNNQATGSRTTHERCWPKEESRWRWKERQSLPRGQGMSLLLLWKSRD